MTQENVNNLASATATTTASDRKGAATTRRRRIAQMIARAWSDTEFKQRLLQQPNVVFTEYGISLPAGMKLQVVENTADTTYFVLPAKPADVSHLALDRLPGQTMDKLGQNLDDCGHCGGCGDCHHCHHCGGCGGCGDCGDCYDGASES